MDNYYVGISYSVIDNSENLEKTYQSINKELENI
mgnify:CR=1 FL=1